MSDLKPGELVCAPACIQTAAFASKNFPIITSVNVRL